MGAAQKDISALRGMEDATVFADEIFGFHVQQAEKLLSLARVAGQDLPVVARCGGLVGRVERQRNGCRPLSTEWWTTPDTPCVCTMRLLTPAVACLIGQRLSNRWRRYSWRSGVSWRERDEIDVGERQSEVHVEATPKAETNNCSVVLMSLQRFRPRS